MEREPPRYTQFEEPGPVMGGMRWNDGRVRLVDYCARTGVVYRKFDAEASMPAPVVHVGPSIVTTPPERARAGEEYVYQASARDADTNGFTWSFVTPPPPGMEIERYDGKITWTPRESCRVQVEIRAYTHHGRQVRQAWTISVGKAAAVSAFVAHPRFVEALRRKQCRTACRSWHGDAGASPSIQSPSRIPSASPCPGRPRPEAGGPRLRCIATGPPVRRFWPGGRRVTGTACRSTAPPDHRPVAAGLPLRL